MIPFINSGIRNCSNDHLKKLFFVIIAIFSVYSTPSNLMNAGKGYCFLWLMILYVLGAIVKKCEIGKNMPVYKAFLGILICTLISWAWKMYGVEFLFFKAKVNNGIVQYYNVVTHTCAAIFHIILFSKLKFRPIWQKVIGFAAPGAFAVYLINLQTYLWIYLENKLKYLIDRPVSTLFLHVVAFSFCYVVLCVLIDFVRQKLFQLFRVKKIAEAVTNFAENKLQAICNRF